MKTASKGLYSTSADHTDLVHWHFGRGGLIEAKSCMVLHTVAVVIIPCDAGSISTIPGQPLLLRNLSLFTSSVKVTGGVNSCLNSF